MQEHMIKVTYFSILAYLCSATFLLAANSEHEANWLKIVEKRLELEQKPVGTFTKNVKQDGKKGALDNALLFYKKEFDELYGEIMPIFQESDDWKLLRENLLKQNEELNKKYNQLKDHYLINQKLSQKKLESYESEIESYYNEAMEMFQEAITEGQATEVKLRKEVRKELKKERRKQPGIEEVWTEDS